jgi:integrase
MNWLTRQLPHGMSRNHLLCRATSTTARGLEGTMQGQIRKRGKSWSVVIYLGPDPKTGKKRYKWFTHGTRREAQAHLVQLLNQVQAGGGIPPTRLLLKDYLEQWLRDYAAGAVTQTTLESYIMIARKHVIPAIGHVPLGRITSQALQGYLSDKLRTGLSPTTVLHQHRLLHEAFHHAVRWGLLPRNPCDFVDPPKKHKVEMRVWDEEQVRLFLAEAKRSSQYYPLYLAAVTTGMRQGELLGLRWKDIDFTLGIASVQQKFYRLGRQPVFSPPKNDKSRPVAFAPALLEVLRGVRDVQAEHRKLLGPEYEDRDLIFCQFNGKPLHAHNVTQRDFRRIIKRSGLPRIRFHDLCHSHATHLLRAGVHPKVVQERLGHSTPAFTLATYSHVLPGMQEEAARLVAQRLLGHDSAT